MHHFLFDTNVGLVIVTFAEALALLVPLLIAVAYLTYAERKVLAAMQLRKGPNVVGWFGLMQPFADALKMVMKETIIPAGANRLARKKAFDVEGEFRRGCIPPSWFFAKCHHGDSIEVSLQCIAQLFRRRVSRVANIIGTT